MTRNWFDSLFSLTPFIFGTPRIKQLPLCYRYHNSRMINYDVERGINVTTDPALRLSDLLIPAASVTHAGNYTCVPNNAVPASIYVHIFNGKLLMINYDVVRGIR